MAYSEGRDNSRQLTKTITPFWAIVGVDTTFVSTFGVNAAKDQNTSGDN